MARFFFDFHQAGEHSPDRWGVEFADAEQAYLAAFEAAQDMWSELLKQRRDPNRCAFVVYGAQGDVLFIFPFQEVLDSCTDRSRLQRTSTAVSVTRAYAMRVRDEFRHQVRRAQELLHESRRLLKRAA